MTQPHPLGAVCTNKTVCSPRVPHLRLRHSAENSRFPSCATIRGGFPKPQVVSSSLAGGTSVPNGLAALATSRLWCTRNHRGPAFLLRPACVRAAFLPAIAYLERTKVAA